MKRYKLTIFFDQEENGLFKADCAHVSISQYCESELIDLQVLRDAGILDDNEHYHNKCYEILRGAIKILTYELDYAFRHIIHEKEAKAELEKKATMTADDNFIV